MELSQRLDLGALNVEPEKPADVSVEARLVELVSRITGENAEPGKTIAELGVSSLDRIELAVRVEEEFGVQLPEDLYTDGLTLEQLAQLAQSATK